MPGKAPDKRPKAATGKKAWQNQKKVKSPKKKDSSLKANAPEQPILGTAISPADGIQSASETPVKMLTALGERLRTLEGAFREGQYSALAEVYAVAMDLRNSTANWLPFVADAVWDGVKGGPKLDERQECLPFVLRVATGLKREGGAKAASKYNAALADAFRQEMPSDEVATYLREGGGIEALAKLEAQRRRHASTPAERAGVTLVPNEETAGKLREMEPGTHFKMRFAVVSSDADGPINISIEKISPYSQGEKKGSVMASVKKR